MITVSIEKYNYTFVVTYYTSDIWKYSSNPPYTDLG